MHSRSPHVIAIVELRLTAAPPDGADNGKGAEHVEPNTAEAKGSETKRSPTTFPASTAATKRKAKI